MIRLTILVILLVFSQYATSVSYKYQTMIFSPFNKGNLVINSIEFDLNYEVASCEQQKEIFGMSKCKEPIPVIRIQDYIEEVYVCDKEVLKMICLVHNDFSFSFPLDDRVSEKTWVFNEVDYKIIDSDFELKLFGVNRIAHVIHAIDKNKKNETIYFYSKKMGLLAYAYPSEQNGQMFLMTYYLSSKKGFGHN